jgi:hypothetical protein
MRSIQEAHARLRKSARLTRVAARGRFLSAQLSARRPKAHDCRTGRQKPKPCETLSQTGQRFERVMAPVGTVVRLDWARLLRIRQTATSGRATIVRISLDGLPVLHLKQHSACHRWDNAHRRSVLRQTLSPEVPPSSLQARSHR